MFVSAKLTFIFTALHGDMQTRYSDEKAVRLSVCLSDRPSVKPVHCDKTEENICPDFYRAAWNADVV